MERGDDSNNRRRRRSESGSIRRNESPFNSTISGPQRRGDQLHRSSRVAFAGYDGPHMRQEITLPLSAVEVSEDFPTIRAILSDRSSESG